MDTLHVLGQFIEMVIPMVWGTFAFGVYLAHEVHFAAPNSEKWLCGAVEGVRSFHQQNSDREKLSKLRGRLQVNRWIRAVHPLNNVWQLLELVRRANKVAT